MFLRKKDADFNKDGNPDIIVMAVKKGSGSMLCRIVESGHGIQEFLVFIWESKKPGAAALREHLIHREAVYGPHEGCVFGDPLDSSSVKGNSFILSFYGGSSWRCMSSLQFRFQNGGFYIIGHTKFCHRTVSEEAEFKEDYNLYYRIDHSRNHRRNRPYGFRENQPGQNEDSES